jgi:hypothetical protein
MPSSCFGRPSWWCIRSDGKTLKDIREQGTDYLMNEIDNLPACVSTEIGDYAETKGALLKLGTLHNSRIVLNNQDIHNSDSVSLVL